VRSLLDVDELSGTELEALLRRATRIRQSIDGGGGRNAALAGRRIALLFAEPSTRTRLSFEIAARALGAEAYTLDPGATSLVKGESLADTARTLSAQGIDALVLRHHRAGAPWVVARYFPGGVVNAGDGWHAHPTQALLDLFTLRRAFDRPDLRGLKVAIVGDLRHSRVARSNAWTLTADGAELWACGPAAWLGGWDELAAELPTDRRIALTDDLARALDGAHAVMALRVQKERMRAANVSLDKYVERYRITGQRMATAAPEAFFLHPGPTNEGLEVTREVIRGPRSLVAEQVRNGVPVRMAVLEAVAGA
jgi:aspartate carbamoyltransferase catalytic subunit